MVVAFSVFDHIYPAPFHLPLLPSTSFFSALPCSTLLYLHFLPFIPVLTCLYLLYSALSCLTLPCPTLPCPVLSHPPCPTLPRPVLSCLTLPCPTLPCPVMSCLTLQDDEHNGSVSPGFSTLSSQRRASITPLENVRESLKGSTYHTDSSLPFSSIFIILILRLLSYSWLHHIK
jgi:hypothetical protein